MRLDNDRNRERAAATLVTVLVVVTVVLAVILLWAFFDSSVTTEDELPQSLRALLRER